MNIQEAKERLPIPVLWAQLNLKGQPAPSGRCPFHDDQRSSFSIYRNGRRFKCHAGCGQGDAVDLLRIARNLSEREAYREFIRMAGGDPDAGRVSTRPDTSAPAATPALNPVTLDCRPGSREQLDRLADLRGVGTVAVDLATQRGLLAFGRHRGCDAWFILDRTRYNVQARRVDGQPFTTRDGSAKALTVRGSIGGWPIGIREAEPFPVIALTEGGPDLLAALALIWFENREAECAAAGMMGAGQAIHAEALPLFAGKRVRIFGHADSAGRKAVEKWSGQLTGAGAEVDACYLGDLRQQDGSPVKDLNDLCRIDSKQVKELGRLLP